MPSLFVEADEPLLVFPSIAAAERFLEAIDVEAGIYPKAYGPSGDVYDVIAHGERVVIHPSGAPPQPEELKLLLLGYLEAVGESPSTRADLATLVAAVEAHEDKFWSEHDPYGERFSTLIPAWSCLATVLALTSAVYVIWRTW